MPGEIQSRRGKQVGSFSLLVIFVVLCLTIFATLGVLSANAELALTKRNTQAISEYYRLDAQGEQLIFQLGQLLAEGNIEEQDVVLIDGVKVKIVERDGMNSVEARLSGNEGQDLLVTMVFNEDGQLIEVKQWNIVSNRQWDYEESKMELWTGIIVE